MITVVIIGILTAAGLPSYNQYILRSHRADVKNMLLTVAQRLEQNHSLTGSYALTPAGAAIVDATIAGWGFGQIPLSGAARYNITFQAVPTATTFTLVATPVGAQLPDACGILTLDNRNLKSAALQNNRSQVTRDCWDR